MFTQLKITAPYDPVGIFINQKKEVAVCLKTYVAIYTLDFKSCLHSIEKNNEGERLFIGAFAATENGTSYPVADKCTSIVINVDLNGVVYWTYAPKTFDPAGIVNYNKEMLIISNAMCSMSFISWTRLESPLTIFSSGIQFPRSLAISPDGILWVTESCSSHQIHLISISWIDNFQIWHIAIRNCTFRFAFSHLPKPLFSMWAIFAHILWWRQNNWKQSAGAREHWYDVGCDIPYYIWCMGIKTRHATFSPFFSMNLRFHSMTTQSKSKHHNANTCTGKT